MSEKNNNMAPCSEGQYLWQRIRESEEYVPMHDPAGAETLELGEVSDTVAACLAWEDKAVGQAADGAFSTSHRQLMNAIASSHNSAPAMEAAPTPATVRPLKLRRPLWARAPWTLVLQRTLAAAMLMVSMAAAGHAVGHRGARILPVESLIDDFDASLRSPAPFDLVADNPRSTSDWLAHRTGMRVTLPAGLHAGVKLVGARGHVLWGRTVAQTQYLKNDTRFALYQIRAPRSGLPALEEVKLNGRTFFVHNRGGYHAIIWRSDENVMAVVSPLATREAMLLADAIRNDNGATPA